MEQLGLKPDFGFELAYAVYIHMSAHTHIYIYTYTYIIYLIIYIGVTPRPPNSGIMDFNCNFPAKIAQQPRDQNHKQFERPNLLDTIFSDVEKKYEITLGAAYLEPDQIYSVGACRDFVG